MRVSTNNAAAEVSNGSANFGQHGDQGSLVLRLRKLSRDVERLALRLGSHSKCDGEIEPRQIVEAIDRRELAPLIRALIKIRRVREGYFSKCLFADPAWDILLDLYLAELEQRRTSVSALCIAAEVPTTTALRWIQTMVDQGLLTRTPDRMDNRRTHIALTPKTFCNMTFYVGALANVLVVNT